MHVKLPLSGSLFSYIAKAIMAFAKEGIPFIFIPLALGVLFLILGHGWTIPGGIALILGLFCAFFFRDPARTIPPEEKAILSPCDGTVMYVGEEDGKKVIRTFLSIFNVHIQRASVQGVVKKVEYRPGKFLPAMNAKAHIENEQNSITVETPSGDYEIVQIAGIIARRIACRVRAGDRLQKGQQVGLIRFGSQVDLYLPSAVTVKVKAGDKITG